MEKIVHAILIDSPSKTIRVVQINPDNPLRSAYALIGCEIIEAVERLPNGDVIYVDEEALTKDERPAGEFMFAGNKFIGRGLIVNESAEDCTWTWTSPHSPIMGLFSSIEFAPDAQVPTFMAVDILAGMAGGKFKVMQSSDFDGFAGAPEGSLICYDFGDGHWTVIVSPGNEALSVHAYGSCGNAGYELTIDGWSEI